MKEAHRTAQNGAKNPRRIKNVLAVIFRAGRGKSGVFVRNVIG